VTNLLPVGRAETVGGVFKRNGDLFLPVDKTLVGTGVGPDGKTYYTENRASVHLHGGDTPWISDGTPYQWFAPAGEADTSVPTSVVNELNANGGLLPIGHFLKGASAKNVPDMPDPGPGAQTFYYPNNQSARMLWYHDHTIGLTRVNVAAGMAAPYVIADTTEDALIASGALPADMIPLVFQDKTFVPNDIALQDANWTSGFRMCTKPMALPTCATTVLPMRPTPSKQTLCSPVPTRQDAGTLAPKSVCLEVFLP
jgi:FtsP/CotA-like multicopper oxidase with cupredoxin domain